MWSRNGCHLYSIESNAGHAFRREADDLGDGLGADFYADWCGIVSSVSMDRLQCGDESLPGNEVLGAS